MNNYADYSGLADDIEHAAKEANAKRRVVMVVPVVCLDCGDSIGNNWVTLLVGDQLVLWGDKGGPILRGCKCTKRAIEDVKAKSQGKVVMRPYGPRPW